MAKEQVYLELDELAFESVVSQFRSKIINLESLIVLALSVSYLHSPEWYLHTTCNASARRTGIQSSLRRSSSSEKMSNTESLRDETRCRSAVGHMDTRLWNKRIDEIAMSITFCYTDAPERGSKGRYSFFVYGKDPSRCLGPCSFICRSDRKSAPRIENVTPFPYIQKGHWIPFLILFSIQKPFIKVLNESTIW